MHYRASTADSSLPVPVAAAGSLHAPAPARSDLATLRRLFPYLWDYKWRAAAALSFMVGAKLANVGVPLLLKKLVDVMNVKPGDVQAVLVVPAALLLAYGLLRLSTTIFTELREWVFAKATEGAARRISLEVFRHLHALSLRFHLERQTGGMTRDIERGTRGVHSLISYSLYSIFPTLIEVTLVLSFLAVKFDVWFAGITGIALVFYIFYTVTVTEWRTQFRKTMNELDSTAHSRAIDSLLNYETVKYFNNEEFEAARYDEGLKRYRHQLIRFHALRIVCIGVPDQFLQVRRITALIIGRRVVVDAVPTHHRQEVCVAELEAARRIQVCPHGCSVWPGDAPPVSRIAGQRVFVRVRSPTPDVAPEAQQFVPPAGAAGASARFWQCAVAISSFLIKVVLGIGLRRQCMNACTSLIKALKRASPALIGHLHPQGSFQRRAVHSPRPTKMMRGHRRPCIGGCVVRQVEVQTAEDGIDAPIGCGFGQSGWCHCGSDPVGRAPDERLQVHRIAADLKMNLSRVAIDLPWAADFVLAPDGVAYLQFTPYGLPGRDDLTQHAQVHG